MKISLNLTLVLAILIVSAVLVVFATNNKSSKANNVGVATGNSLLAQKNSEGGVEVEAVPNVSRDKKLWSFKITLTTHSGSLDEDLIEVSYLSDEKGNILQPKAWEGSPPGGHHRQGNLIFPPFSQTPQSVSLKISDVGQIPERSFTWNI